MVVVVVDGKQIEVRGRAAEIIAWLAQAAKKVNVGSIGAHFLYRGPSLKVVLETEETINGF